MVEFYFGDSTDVFRYSTSLACFHRAVDFLRSGRSFSGFVHLWCIYRFDGKLFPIHLGRLAIENGLVFYTARKESVPIFLPPYRVWYYRGLSFSCSSIVRGTIFFLNFSKEAGFYEFSGELDCFGSPLVRRLGTRSLVVLPAHRFDLLGVPRIPLFRSVYDVL